MFLTNCYVEIIGVLLATIWVAGGQWSEDHSSTGSKSTQLSTIRYKHGPAQIRIGHSAVTDASVGNSEMMSGDQGLELDSFTAAPGKYGGSEYA